MQIVIDIPEELFESAKEGYMCGNGIIVSAIANGIPLPKGHGRLIDADELKKHQYHDNNRYENAVAVAYISWADTIVKADKGEEKEQ